jgi:hypothetical protein
VQRDLSVDVTDERSTPSCETFGPVPSSGRKTAKLLGEDRRRFSSWQKDAGTLAPDKEEVLRDWWQTVLHLLSFQSFDKEKLRSLLEQTRPMPVNPFLAITFPNLQLRAREPG